LVNECKWKENEGAKMIDLKNKVALITGGSRGIGAASAIMFAKAGCDVAVNFRSDEKAAVNVVSKCRTEGVRAMSIRANVANRAEVERMFADVVGELGRIDVLVNNAGVWKYAEIQNMTEEQLSDTIDINLNGLIYCCTAAAKLMIEQKSGNIINIASTAGQRGEAFHSHYAASKGAVISLTKSLATELAPHNIRVNCVAPGWVETDMSYESLIGPDREQILSLIPLGRAGRPEELAGPILFMASDLASFITGEILNVNGGAVLCG
jgi:3-oxoacyl-[acyl-carrier protein] reductase